MQSDISMTIKTEETKTTKLNLHTIDSGLRKAADRTVRPYFTSQK